MSAACVPLLDGPLRDGHAVACAHAAEELVKVQAFIHCALELEEWAAVRLEWVRRARQALACARGALEAVDAGLTEEGAS